LKKYISKKIKEFISKPLFDEKIILKKILIIPKSPLLLLHIIKLSF